MSHSRVLSEDALAILRARGDQAGLNNGFRNVSNSSWITHDSLDTQATVELPEYLESVQTLRFLEFNEYTSGIIFEKFQVSKNENPDRAHILQSAIDHIKSVAGDATERDHDQTWFQTMQAIGLTSNYQMRVMGGDAQMRNMGSAKTWAIEMAELRYTFLRQIDQIIKTPEQGTNRGVSHISGNKLLSGRPNVPDRSSSKGPQMAKFYGSAGPSKPSTSTSTADPPELLEGHVMLMKGGALHRLQRIHIAGGNLNFQNVLSTPPGDFGRLVGGFYVTKNPQVAWQYAKWAEKLVDGKVVPCGVMTVGVPQDLLSSMRDVFGADWKEFVWANRTGNVVIDGSHRLHYLTTYQWLVGCVCSQANMVVQELQSSDELRMWKLDGGEAAQQFWTGDPTMIGLLGQRCKGKVWIQGLAA